MSAIKNNFNSLDKNHGKITNLVTTIIVTFSLFDPEWKFGRVLTEDTDTKKNKLVSQTLPICNKMCFFTYDILRSVFIFIICSDT